MDDEERRTTTIAFVIAVVLLLVSAAAALVFGGQLLPTLGIVVVGASLFLPLRRTAVLVVLIIALAGAVILLRDIEHSGVRFGNVLLASALALLASWTVSQRMRRIRELNTTQASVFASVPDGLAVLSLDGTILQCNEALHVLVPNAAVGQRLHPLLGHIRRDGSACDGGCLLDTPRLEAPTTVVEGESMTGQESTLALEYTAAPIDDTAVVVSLRDVSALKEAEQNRRLLVEAAARDGEQKHLLKALGAPAFSQLPRVRGIDFDVYSTPSTPDAPSGGDLVDITELSDGRILVMIADALGDRVLSVRDASKVLYFARAYVTAGIRLEEVVSRTAAALANEPDPPDVSLMVAVIDPESGRLDLVGGGHPPALLVRNNGAAEWLESDGQGIGQGLPAAGIVLTRLLTPGDSLVLYTDGVVDASRDVFEGLSALRSSVTALRKRPANGWARTVTEAVIPPGQNSGSATVLLVRLDGDSGSLQTTATL